MENYLYIGSLIIGVFVLAFILLELWLRRRRFNIVDPSLFKFNQPSKTYSEMVEPSFTAATPEPTAATMKKESQSASQPDEDDFLVLSVLAKPNCTFASYELLQAISSAGLQFGDMNIFHYFSPEDKEQKLFSLASATKPGDFNLDKIGDFSCKGLTLFLDLSQVANPAFAFDIMLKTAEQLAEDLDGEICAGPNHPWNLAKLNSYKQKILQYC